MASPCPPTVCDIDKYPNYCLYNPFGPNANCTLDACCPEYSVYAYVPSLAFNMILGAIWIVVMTLHACFGLFTGHWWFVGFMAAGCLDEIAGYTGRALMSRDLWDFEPFILQVVCVTTAPVFFCAAIYVLLAKTISTFGSSFARFNPSLIYWVFILCDILSLALQAAGGALSSVSSGKNDNGVNLALAGLVLQVITLVIFCGLYGDYLWRYLRSEQFKQRALRQRSFGPRLKRFYALEWLAVVAILVRCAFRVHELKEGYKPSNKMLQQEGLFIGLEGVPTILAAIFLLVGHPGFIFRDGIATIRFGDGIARRSPLMSSSKEHELEGMGDQAAQGPAE